MKLLNKPIQNPLNGSISTHWKVVEYAHNINDNKIYLVLWWYVSEEIAKNFPSMRNDVKSYSLDTVKKYIQEEVIEDVEFEEVLESEAVIAEDGTIISPHIPYQPAGVFPVRTWRYVDVWSNKSEYINVDNLVNVIIPFIHNELLSKWDFINSELV